MGLNFPLVRAAIFRAGRSKLLIAALSILCLPTACARQVDPVFIPGTSISLGEALFLPSHSRKVPLGAASEGRLCGDLQILKGSKLSNSAITLANNDLLLLARSRHCGIEIKENVPDDLVSATDRISEHGCSFALQMKDEALDKIYVSSEPYNRQKAAECITRAGLFLSGLQGSLHLKSEELLVPRDKSYLAAEAHLPDRVSMLYIIMRMCGVEPASIIKRDQIPTKLACEGRE
jgi:hypothetical protein